MAKAGPYRKWRFAIGAITLFLIFVGVLLLGKAMDRRSYRLDYPELIAESANEYGLDRYLVAAVIHVESGNDPDAVSKSGALGLMQVMPETGEWIAGKLGLSDFTPEQLKTPEVNIRMGCWYLSFLQERFQGNRINMIAAYNAGHGNVEKWLADGELSRDGQLYHIPIEETEKYVEKVQRAYEKYKTLYPEWPQP